MKATHRRTIGRSLAMTPVLALVVLLFAPSARSANIVNVAINIPAAVYDNPCVGEPVALSGDLRLLLNITADQGGGYHYVSKWTAQYAGTGLISGVAYRASESKQESWSSRQLPASHTTRSVVRLISRGVGVGFLSTTFTTAIDASGVPTVTVDSVSVTCVG